jgi:thiamine kinase-like enzyme
MASLVNARAQQDAVNAHGSQLVTVDVVIDLADAESFHRNAKFVLQTLVPDFFSGGPNDTLGYDVIVGGVTNQVLRVYSTVSNQKAILRIFGRGTDAFIDRTVENKIFQTLSSRGVGPCLYGLFTNGRLEGFVPGRNIETVEMVQDVISKEVCKSMCRFHEEQADISRECFVFTIMDRLGALIADLVRTNASSGDEESEKQCATVALIDKFQVMEEFSWYRDLLKTRLETYQDTILATFSSVNCNDYYYNAGLVFGYTIVLSHNDLLPGNIMVSPSDLTDATECTLTFIDYEYCAHNCRAFDFANHFIGRVL